MVVEIARYCVRNSFIFSDLRVVLGKGARRGARVGIELFKTGGVFC